MKDKDEKIVSAQAMVNDVVAQVSAIINQNNYDKETMLKLKERMEELSDMLNSIKTGKADF